MALKERREWPSSGFSIDKVVPHAYTYLNSLEYSLCCETIKNSIENVSLKSSCRREALSNALLSVEVVSSGYCDASIHFPPFYKSLIRNGDDIPLRRKGSKSNSK